MAPVARRRAPTAADQRREAEPARLVLPVGQAARRPDPIRPDNRRRSRNPAALDPARGRAAAGSLAARPPAQTPQRVDQRAPEAHLRPVTSPTPLVGALSLN